eukprot:TRINITY_DN673_c1_g2_i1.p1 TRINITY_DN673_c1_g2~~TRINITY_DN673_c1_g2_i1.p1  ORF type:complete len:547 (+),score=189.98 TRINITY_DN673_c1_g2_i1:101-1642(+)
MALCAADIDFGDGGAFPEIHISQYPLGMGRPGKKSNALALTTDATGAVQHTALVRQGQRADKTIFSKVSDALPKVYDPEELARPTEDDVAATTEKTRLALEAITTTKISGHRPNAGLMAHGETKYIRYQASRPASGADVVDERIVQMVELPKDPLEPPKFRVKRVPGGPPSPPVPVLHSPPRKVTAKDMQDWKVPPCISNWKNPKGYTIPLDKRLAADGRGLQEVTVNDNFAKLSEALYMAERKAREEVDRRKENAKKIALKQKELRESELREMARQAREEKAQLAASGPGATAERPEDAEERRARDEVREERRRLWEKARRQQERKASGRGGTDRELERDVTEQFALRGAAGVQPTRSGEGMYDNRLFNQDAGLGSGLADGDGAAYSKALFGDKRQDKGQFRADRKALDEEHQRQANLSAAPKSIEFEKDAADDDPFGLFDILKEARRPPPQQQQRSASPGGGSSTGGRKRRREDPDPAAADSPPRRRRRRGDDGEQKQRDRSEDDRHRRRR